jgi:hypothetical protein
VLFSSTLVGQTDNYGKTLNMGIGLGYYGYIGHSTPVFHANYEFDVARNFTLAPFVAYYSYQNSNYWGNSNNPFKYYYYRSTVLPVGVKGTYYFDRILGAGANWDFYLAGSLGIVFRSTAWDAGYQGNRTIDKGRGGAYLDVHIGTEYHFNSKTGVFLDLSSGVSTVGIALHR